MVVEVWVPADEPRWEIFVGLGGSWLWRLVGLVGEVGFTSRAGLPFRGGVQGARSLSDTLASQEMPRE